MGLADGGAWEKEFGPMEKVNNARCLVPGQGHRVENCTHCRDAGACKNRPTSVGAPPMDPSLPGIPCVDGGEMQFVREGDPIPETGAYRVVDGSPLVDDGVIDVEEYAKINYGLVSKDSTAKQTNPKDLIGSDKIPMHLWPETASALGALGCLDGMLKYGRENWRGCGVRASIYYDACRRHLNKWFSGEDTDPDSGLPHLAHALSCLAIIVDAAAAGKLTDDRSFTNGYVKLMEELTAHVPRLKERHAGKNPKHFTIEDAR